MSTGSNKITSGSAAAWLSYAKDETRTLEQTLGYYATGASGKVYEEAWGRGAARLGITGGVTRAEFEDLFHGRWQGRQLTQSSYRPVYELDEKGRPLRDEFGDKVPVKVPVVDKAGVVQLDEHGSVRLKTKTESARVNGIDLTVSAPKSASEFQVMYPDKAHLVDEAWLQACKLMVEYVVEEHAKLVNAAVAAPSLVGARATKTQGSATQRQAGVELIVFPALQRAARATEETIRRGDPADPSLHVHLLIMGPAWFDGRYLTVDDYGLKGNKNPLFREDVVMGEFARLLTAQGIACDYWTDKKGRTRFEIAGSNPDVRSHFSTNTERAHRLQDSFEAEYGRPMTKAEQDEVMKRTKLKKSKLDKEADKNGVYQLWRHSLVRAGLRSQIPAPDTQASTLPDLATRLEELVRRCEAPSGFTAEDATFGPDLIPRTVARCAVGLSLSPDELRAATAAIEASLPVVREAAEPRHRLYSTRSVLQAENDVAQALATRASASHPSPSADDVQEAMMASAVPLDLEQAAAIRAACRPNKLQMIQGPAGGGKSAIMKIVGRAYRSDSGGCNRIVATATSGKIANEIGAKVAADVAGSIASVLYQIRKGQLKCTKRTLVVLDEAAFVSTHDMQALLAAIGPAKLIALGDQGQLPNIGAGGWWADACNRFPVAELTTVYRQTDPRDIAAFADLRAGRSRRAIESLHARGLVHAAENASHRTASVLRDYTDLRDAGRSVTDVRVLVDSSNELVDEINRAIQRERISRLEIGSVGYELTEIDSGRRWRLHQGDEVIFLQSHSLRGRPTVKNGRVGRLVDLNIDSGHAEVRLDDGTTTSVRLSHLAHQQLLGPSYCMHVAKFQGGEVPVALCLPGGQGQATRNSGYSMLTRAKEQARVYLDKESAGEDRDPVDHLVSLWATEADKVTASKQMAESAKLARTSATEQQRQPSTAALRRAVMGQAHREADAEAERERAIGMADREQGRRARVAEPHSWRERMSQKDHGADLAAEMERQAAERVRDRDLGLEL